MVCPRAMIFIGVIFVAFAPSALGVGETVTLDSTRPTYTFNSPGYPYLQSSSEGKWTINAPTAQTMTISCPEIDLITFLDCSFNRFSILVNDQERSICQTNNGASDSAATTRYEVEYSYWLFFPSFIKGFTCTVSFTSAAITPAATPPTTTPPANPSTCSCGIENQPIVRIVGGEDAAPHQFPWMALLQVTVGTSIALCSASLISLEWVVTAAHCVDGSVQPSQITLILGEHDRQANESPRSISRRGIQIIIHPQWNVNLVVNDIALVKITPVPRTREISPICLPFNSKTISGTGRAAGWGLLTEGGSTSDIVQVVEMNLHTASECRIINRISSSVITDDMICASGGGKDSCQGDSGGPLFMTENDSNFLIGIVSKGPGCARPNTAGIYTKVESFTDWIESATQESFCQIIEL